MQFLITICIILSQLFSFSIKGEGKNEVVLPTASVPQQTAAVDTSFVERCTEFLRSSSTNLSTANRQNSHNSHSGFHQSIYSASVGFNKWLPLQAFFPNKYEAGTHIPIALLLIFPKHYFW
ncbi:MAG: hypothetical protein ABIN57_00925 [Chitinophagaceae bacterium]